MERDLLMGATGSPGRTGRPAVAALLGLVLLVAGPSCGKKEGGGPSGEGPGASGFSMPAPKEAGRTDIRPAAGKREVTVTPWFPSRVEPPSISVKPESGRVTEVVEVQWYVNGAASQKGQPLSPGAFKRGDRIQAEVTVREDGSDTVVKTREVVAGNAPAAVVAARIEPVNPVTGDTVRAIAAARDEDGDPVRTRFEWFVDNVAVQGNDRDTLWLKGVKRGAWIHVRAIPNDGIADGVYNESSRHRVVNALPVVKSRLPKELPPGRTFMYRIEAEDPDGDPLTFALKKGPMGIVLNGSTLEWQVPDGYFGEPVDIEVEISDGQGGRTVQNIGVTILPPQ